MSSYVVLLSRDLNGNHVIQKCLQKLPPNYCDFIFEAACENCVKIAKHRHGCCVLQRCFDHGTPKQCEQLSLKVGENALEIRVTNLWVNRLIGDMQPGAQKYTYADMQFYQKDSPLEPSGLIGPVQLVVKE